MGTSLHFYEDRKPASCKACPRYSEVGLLPSGNRTPDLYIVGGTPTYRSLNSGVAFDDNAERVLHRALQDLARQSGLIKQCKIRTSYSVRCGADKPKKPSKDACMPLLQQDILMAKPKVIVVCGADAMKALGIKANHKVLAGRFTEAVIHGTRFPVMVTQHVVSVYMTPGLYGIFKEDLLKAFNSVLEKTTPKVPITELTKDYIYPKSTEEAIQLLRMIIGYHGRGGDPKNWLVSGDTETNTLHMYRDDAKCIMFSFSWDKGKATAITFNHKNTNYDWEPLVPYLIELLTSKPIVWHNHKFDWSVCFRVLGVKVPAFWDTLLGEHLLDENRKGFYSLKKVLLYYVPEFAGYEQAVKDSLVTSLDESEEPEAVLPEVQGNLERGLDPGASEAERVIYDRILTLQEAIKQKKQDRSPLTRKRGSLRSKCTRGTITDEEMVKLDELDTALAEFDKDLDALVEDVKHARQELREAERKRGSSSTYEDVPLNILQVYAAIDADITRQIACIQITKMRGTGLYKLMVDLVAPLSSVIAEMEYTGVKVDTAYMDELDDILHNKAEEHKAELFRLVGHTFNPSSSSPELAEVLYNERGMKILKTSDNGSPATDKATLAQLESTAEGNDRKILEHLRLYKVYDKGSSGQIRGAHGFRTLSCLDGRLHTSFNINGTATGRLSSANPNLQNVPPDVKGHNVKRIFIPDTPDHVIVNVDYSGAEVRVLTAYAKDQALIDTLRDPAQDVHSLFGARISAVKSPKNPKLYEDFLLARMDSAFAAANLSEDKLKRWHEIYPQHKEYLDERKAAKTTTFGTLYGNTKYSLAERLSIGEDAAQQLIDSLFLAFPLIKEYVDSTTREVLRHGYVETHFGRRRRFPLQYGRLASAAKREAVNFKIQSTSSDIVMSQLVEIAHNAHKIDAKPILTVHDSLVLHMHKRALPKLRTFLNYWARDRIQEKFPWLPVPMQYDVEMGDSYGDKYGLEEYMEVRGIAA